MVRYYLLIILLSSLATLNAQNEHRFADPDATWHACNQTGTYVSGWTHSWIEWGPESYPLYRVLKDTVIDDLTYQAISSGGMASAHFVRRDSTGKVFYYDNWDVDDEEVNQGDRLIYDFSLQPGDTLDLPSPSRSVGCLYKGFTSYSLGRLIVDSVDSITIGKPHKRLYLHNFGYPQFKKIEMIDGVGATNLFFLSPYLWEMSWPEGYEWTLLNFYEPNVNYNFSSGCLMDVEEKKTSGFHLFPNPSDGNLNVSGIVEETTFTLFNLHGEKILENSLTRGNNRIELSHLETGVYLYIIGDSEKVGKLLVK